MDIRAKSILDVIQSVEGAENAIIAGGAVRDTVFNLIPKDIDIFIPEKSAQNVYKTLGKVLNNNFEEKTENYGSLITKFNVKGFEFEGVKFDIVTSHYTNDKEFGLNVVKEFDFGLNMVYYDGISIDDSNEDFTSDRNRGTMTLTNLSYIGDLPRSVDKFNRISGKFKENLGYSLEFRASCLKIIHDGKEVEEKPRKIKSKLGRPIGNDEWLIERALRPDQDGAGVVVPVF